MFDGHAVAQHARDELGIVPVLGVELLAESLDGGLVAALVLELEVVALGAIGIHLLDNLSLRHALGQQYALLVVLQAGEYLVGIAVEQSDEGHPLLLVVLEAYHVALQRLRTHLGHLRVLAGRHGAGRLHVVVLHLGLLLVVLRDGHHHAGSRTVAVDGATLAARTPGLDIQPVHQLLVHVGGQIHGDADAVVHPLLDGTLHLHLHQPVHVVGRSFIIR